MDERRLGWLALAWFDGFGAKTLRKLRRHFKDDGVSAYSASRQNLLSFGITEFMTDRFCTWRASVEPDMLARRCEAEAIRFVLDTDEEYPSYLKHSSDPPVALFIRGEPLSLMRPVAIVGTRAATGYGRRVTASLTQSLVVAGCEIVSGLALGIDACAHEAALDVGGKTIAVVAGGCNDDAIYPRNNFPIAKRILEHRGTIVTECPPGTESMKHLFPLRNRIIASLAVATIIVEAAEKSGSLITAKLALEENRDVFAVPGPITSEQSVGVNRLLQHGATPCLGAEDILQLFDLRPTATTTNIEPTDDERQTLEILDRPLHVDELIRALEIPTWQATSLLSTMELKHLIENQGAGMYARTTLGKNAVKEKSHPESDEGTS